MPPQGFRCKRCGHCCIELETASLPCSKDDYRRWKNEGREDILAWVGAIAPGGTILMLEMWVNPETGRTPRHCPWVGQESRDGAYTCRIHKTKPLVCAEYPVSEQHARHTGCPGIEC